MDLILWRHADAEDWQEGCDDLARPLTSRGLKQAARISGWLDRKLPEGTRVVCSPALRGAGAPPDLLRDVTLLHDDSPEQDASCPTWRMWLKAAGIDGVDAGRGLHFNQASLVLEAAIAGRGAALAKVQLAGEDLRNGRLVRLFDVSQPVAFGYYFVCPPAKAAQRKVALFRDWILRETKADAAYPKKN